MPFQALFSMLLGRGAMPPESVVKESWPRLTMMAFTTGKSQFSTTADSNFKPFRAIFDPQSVKKEAKKASHGHDDEVQEVPKPSCRLTPTCRHIIDRI